jgi:hypothetical protein
MLLDRDLSLFCLGDTKQKAEEDGGADPEDSSETRTRDRSRSAVSVTMTRA